MGQGWCENVYWRSAAREDEREPVNTGEKPDGRFKPRQSGNPSGDGRWYLGATSVGARSQLLGRRQEPADVNEGTARPNRRQLAGVPTRTRRSTPSIASRRDASWSSVSIEHSSTMTVRYAFS